MGTEIESTESRTIGSCDFEFGDDEHEALCVVESGYPSYGEHEMIGYGSGPISRSNKPMPYSDSSGIDDMLKGVYTHDDVEGLDFWDVSGPINDVASGVVGVCGEETTEEEREEDGE